MNTQFLYITIGALTIAVANGMTSNASIAQSGPTSGPTSSFCNYAVDSPCDPEHTSENPVAGNPVSLQTTMAKASFAFGSDVGPSPLSGGKRARGTLAYNHFGVSLQSGHYHGPGYTASFQALPLDYSIPFNDPRWALKIGLPLGYAEINNTRFFSGSLAVGLRVPIYDYWSLTPEIRYGMIRNKTLGIDSRLLNASITSNFRQPLRNGYHLVIGNSVTHSRSTSTDTNNNKLRNMIYQNGVELSGPMQMKLYGLPTNWQFSVVVGKVSGSPTFVDEWVDASLSLGTVGSKNGVTWDSVRIGLTYTYANNGIEGINLNFGYEF